MESWHHISPRITAVRIARGKSYLMVFSVYAPVQQGGVSSARTTQFYEQLTAKVTEAKAKGDTVIIGGDMNTSIKAEDAPNLIGRWASNKTSANAKGLIEFMLEHKMAAIGTFQKTQWRD